VENPEAYNLLTSGLRYLLVAFAALMLWWLVLRPMQRRNASHQAQMLALSAAEPGAALLPTSTGTGTSVVVAGQESRPTPCRANRRCMSRTCRACNRSPPKTRGWSP
jgi:flagellar M-ring protein FliF